jgi:hypothetical protein
MACLVLPSPGGLFDEQPPDAPSVVGPKPPEKEPLDDLAQPFLGLLGREEDGGGIWLRCVQDGPRGGTGENAVPANRRSGLKCP